MNKIPSFLLDQPASSSYKKYEGKVRGAFIEKGINQLTGVIKAGYIQWEDASIEGLFQKIDARVKILFLLFYVLIVSITKEIMPELGICSFIFILVLVSRLNIIGFYKKVFLLAFFFGFLIALPSAFNLVTGGEIILPLLHLSGDKQFWIYHIPSEIGITREGINVVAMLTLRVMNSLSIAFLVMHTTPFPDIIKALKILKIPESFLMIITLSYKYIFIFAKTVEEMHVAKKSRLVGQVNNADVRGWIAGRISFIFRKTRMRCEDIFRAMLGRGFSQDIKFHKPDKLRPFDLVSGSILICIGVIFLIA